MDEFKPIETQEQFNEMIKDRIARAEGKVRAEYSDYDELKQKSAGYEQQIADLTSQLENVAPEKDAKISELEKQLHTYEIDSVKTKAALQYGIPLEVASRISGDDEASIMKDAEAIAPLFAKKGPAPLASPTPAGSSVEGSLLALSRKLTER